MSFLNKVFSKTLDKENNKKTDDKSVKISVGKKLAKDEKKDKVKKTQSMKELYEQTNKQFLPEQKKQTDKQQLLIKEDDKNRKKQRKFNNAYKVLIKPLITEKVTHLGKQNKHCFEVAKDANKIEIAKAINEVYGIKPVSVNIVRVIGKNVRHGKTKGRQKDWKKAIITLPIGSQINL